VSPPAPPGPWHAHAGPKDGPALERDGWPSMGVFANATDPLPVGVAHGAGWTPDPMDPDRPPWALFRLAVGKVPLPGVWCLVGREFVRTEAPRRGARLTSPPSP